MEEVVHLLWRRHCRIPIRKNQLHQCHANARAAGSYLRAPDTVGVDHSQHFTVRRWRIEESDHFEVGRRSLNLQIGSCAQSAARQPPDCVFDAERAQWGLSPLFGLGHPIPGVILLFLHQNAMNNDESRIKDQLQRTLWTHQAAMTHTKTTMKTPAHTTAPHLMQQERPVRNVALIQARPSHQHRSP